VDTYITKVGGCRVKRMNTAWFRCAALNVGHMHTCGHAGRLAMLSRSDRRIMATITAVEVVMEEVKEKYSGKRTRIPVDRVMKCVDDMHDIIGLEAEDEKDRLKTVRQLERIGRDVDHFCDVNLRLHRLRARMYTSFLLQLIDNHVDSIQRPGKKRAVVRNLQRRLNALHNYFDRNLDHNDEYRAMSGIAEKWNSWKFAV
jgi:hypothetical protein